MGSFKVRLRGFNFRAFVPKGETFVESQDAVDETAPVPAAWLKAMAGSTPVAATWLLVDARDERSAVTAFRQAHEVALSKRLSKPDKKNRTPFVVEKVG